MVLFAESVAVTLYENVPFTVGVPVIKPVLSIVTPVGKPVAEIEYGGLPLVIATEVGGIAVFCKTVSEGHTTVNAC